MLVIAVISTEQIVALKRLKMEKEKEGFPITSLREINTLLKVQHENIVTVRVSICSLGTNSLNWPQSENLADILWSCLLSELLYLTSETFLDGSF